MSNIREIDLKLQSEIQAKDARDILLEYGNKTIPYAIDLLEGLYFGSFTTDTLFGKRKYVAHSISVVNKNYDEGVTKKSTLVTASVLRSDDTDLNECVFTARVTTGATGAVHGSYSIKLQDNGEIESGILCKESGNYFWFTTTKRLDVVINAVEQGVMPTIRHHVAMSISRLFTRNISESGSSLAIEFRNNIRELFGVDKETKYLAVTRVDEIVFKAVHEDYCSGILPLVVYSNGEGDEKYLERAVDYVKQLIDKASKEIQTKGD